MLHVLQSLKDGKTMLTDVPVPEPTSVGLIVESRASVISAGTERMLVDFGRSGWIEKARSQPDKVRQVIDKVRTDGIIATAEAVRAKLDAPIPLGYCHAGVVVSRGAQVTEFAPGDRVVTNGPHAEFVSVPRTLAARIPERVTFEQAAFTPLAAIGLQGLRLAEPTLGETVVVYGLGLIGLLTVQLARAAGCRVLGVDRVVGRCALAERFGAASICVEDGGDVAEAVLQATGGIGADAVLLTLATDSDEPVHAAATMSRKRGRIVLVGVSGLQLRRDDFYKKELSFQVSCSYGPGRYDAQYEDGGRDYPLPFVRWTEGRNFDAVLSLMADGRVDPSPLITHRFPVARAPEAYDVVHDDSSALGIVLTYEPKAPPAPRAHPRSAPAPSAPGAKGAKGAIACIGAGEFASRILVPAFKAAGATLEVVASRGGLSAGVLAQRAGFRQATAVADQAITDPAVDTVVVATRHDSHAEWATRALQQGRYVFVEKPLAITDADVDRVAAAARASRALLCVGFNRRFAPDAVELSSVLRSRAGPATVSMTINAGRVPADHWTRNPSVGGGRIVGEACHFIDFARFLVGAPITALQVSCARARDSTPIDDVVLLQLSFADGSIASINYLANGSKRFPKERIEAFFDGKVARIDNFRRIEGWNVSVRSRWPRRQDKGHAALVRAFVDAVRGGGASPIPLAELLEVSRVSIAAERLARAGGGSVLVGAEGVVEGRAVGAGS